MNALVGALIEKRDLLAPEHVSFPRRDCVPLDVRQHSGILRSPSQRAELNSRTTPWAPRSVIRVKSVASCCAEIDLLSNRGVGTRMEASRHSGRVSSGLLARDEKTWFV